MTFCGNVPIPDALPLPTERNHIRRTCGNCAFSADLLPPGGLSVVTVKCRRDGHGFDNHPVPGQVYPSSRGGCLHHQYRARVIKLQEHGKTWN